MSWTYIVLGIIGLSGGLIVSAGVFALITSTGLMARFAGKTHTARYVKAYESAVVFGGTWWNLFWVMSIHFGIGDIWGNGLLTVMGLCQGIFVGCLAISLAEALNATAIFARRAKLSMGLSFLIIAISIGKIVGSIIQFSHGWVK